eukprot:symbB.v1.2.014751.t1/scaffold1081.1/size139474/8
MGSACIHPSDSKDAEFSVNEDDGFDLSNNVPVVWPQMTSPSLKPRPKQKSVRPEGSILPLRKVGQQSPWASASRVAAVASLQRIIGRRPDFNGLWFCFETVGDMDALLVSLEVGWAKRCAASAINYGAGYVSRRIQQNHDDIEMEVIGTPSDFTQTFRVDNGWQRVSGPENELQVNPYWEKSGVLRVDQTELDGSSPVILRHELQEFGLLISMTAVDGVSASWRFRK